MNRTLLFVSLSLLHACGSPGWEERAPTLAEIRPVVLQEEKQALPEKSLAELSQIYQDVLAHQLESQKQLQVTHRLADIEMLDAEESMDRLEHADANFSDAIEIYENLLAQNPDYPHQDRIFYQLSKAYAMSGQSDKSQAALNTLAQVAPQSPYLPEAYFRLAERQFVVSDYAAAERLYARVIRYGAETAYFTRALYMQGWSLFKQDRYEESAASFSANLDQFLQQDPPLETLQRGDQEMVRDSLRALSIAFSKLEGVATIERVYNRLGRRPYEHRLYESLGVLYLSQKRYADSAGAYQAFINRDPGSRRAHYFQLRVIEAFEFAGFADSILQAKQDYVETFTVAGEYYLASDEVSKQAIDGHLQTYIPELASYYHALAQASDISGDGGEKSKAANPGESPYAQAAHYYKLYLDSFPQDSRVPELAFLLAESQYEAGQYEEAIVSYEWVAYICGDPENAADAAYTAILAYGNLESQMEGEIAPELMRRRIDAELRFQSSFPGDTRAPAVLGHATTELMNLEDFSAALGAASTLLALTPAPDTELLTPALLVSGHSLFALGDYARAEDFYRQSLALLDEQDERSEPTHERLAASIYRQGEEAVASNEYQLAASHFQRVMESAPESDIRISAQFDAAQALIQANELERANSLLRDFRESYPESELSAGIGATLLHNYEQLQQWSAAAMELDTLSQQGVDGGQPRESLLMAARYYDEAGEIETATSRYSEYVETFPDPVADALEAADRVANLYASEGNTKAQHSWFEKIMRLHDQAGEQQSDRTRYLAAHAASVLAEKDFNAFSTLTLDQPIKKTLPRKKAAMEEALAAYNRCNSYAVEQFVTLCTYQLGRIYQQLSADLMDSERPKGLDMLALEQYDIMLEEQVYPFEEKAIEIHESNAGRSRKGVYDQWVKRSFAALGELLPARYRKIEAEDASHLAALTRGIELPVDPRTPRNIRNYNRDGMTLRQMGEFEAAEQEYLAALEKSADDPITHYNIGILYDLYLGEADRALKHYLRYQELTGQANRQVAGWIVDLQRRQLSLAEEAL
jgi:tetratricopeptide (TPR) repeat protein